MPGRLGAGGDLCPLTAGLDMVELVLSDLESSVAVGRLNPGEGGRSCLVI